MAGRGHVIQLEPGIDDLASLLKARDDGDPAIGIGGVFDFFGHVSLQK